MEWRPTFSGDGDVDLCGALDSFDGHELSAGTQGVSTGSRRADLRAGPQRSRTILRVRTPCALVSR